MFKNKNFRRPMSSSSSSSPSTSTSTTTTNPSFSGLLTNVKNTKNTPHGPEQYAQIKDKIKVFDAKSFLLPPCSFVDGAVPPPPRPNYVRLCCISDTHNAHDVLTKLLPPADPQNMILVHAGDFTDVGKPKDIEKFCKWLVEIRPRFKATVVIAGNHDISLDEEFYNSEDNNWQRFGHQEKCDSKAMKQMLKNSCTHYLENESAEIAGLKFYGSPYSPWFYDWAFNRNRHLQCHNDWQQIPTDTDVLITHGPPLGHNDQCVPSMEHFGDADLLDWIEEYKPMLSISGHLHESYGVTTNGNTVFLNASSLNVKYDFSRPNMPMVIDVPVGKEVK